MTYPGWASWQGPSSGKNENFSFIALVGPSPVNAETLIPLPKPLKLLGILLFMDLNMIMVEIYCILLVKD